MKQLFSLMFAMGIAVVMNAQTGTWYPFAATPVNYQYVTMKSDKKGDFYISASLLGIGGKAYGGVARWNDTTWTNVGNLETNSSVFDMAFDSKGNLYACGDLRLKDASGNLLFMGVGKWDGKAWTSIAESISPYPNTIAVSPTTGDVYVGGQFSNVESKAGTKYIAKWDGKVWAAATPNTLDDQVKQIEIDKKGTVYIRGDFNNADNIVLNRVAVLNADKWKALDGGYKGNKNYPFSDMGFDSKDNFWVAGSFSSIGTKSISYLAYWDGTAWNAPSVPAVGPVLSMSFGDKDLPYITVESFDVNLYSIENNAYTKIPNAPTKIRGLYFDTVKKRLYVSGTFDNPSDKLTYFQIKPNSAAKDLEEVAQLLVSPNPSSERLNVDFKTTLSTATTLQVWSVSGSLMSTQVLESGTRTATLDVSAFATGSYILQFTNAKGEQFSSVFVKE